GSVWPTTIASPRTLLGRVRRRIPASLIRLSRTTKSEQAAGGQGAPIKSHDAADAGGCTGIERLQLPGPISQRGAQDNRSRGAKQLVCRLLSLPLADVGIDCGAGSRVGQFPHGGQIGAQFGSRTARRIVV